MRRIALLLVPILAVALAACAGGGPRSIGVRMYDDMRYDPARFDMRAGETITFEVTNAGTVAHEFFVGNIPEHEAHALEMRQSGHADDAHANPSALNLGPGEKGSLTYTFTDIGELMVGCHEPGHYEAGMVAPITVHP